MKKLVIIIAIVGVVLGETFVDKTTSLMWQDDVSAKTTKLDWSGAIEYCQKLSLRGYTDWRLPTRMELLSIADKSKIFPAIKNGINNVVSDGYWSSSPYVSDASRVWGVYFDDGNGNWGNRSSTFYVRCVRGSRDTLSFDSFSQTYTIALEQALASLPQAPITTELTKGKFEKQAEFERRVIETKRANELALIKYKKEYQAYYPKAKRDAMQTALELYYGKPIISGLDYDVENELFGAKLSFERNPKVEQNIVLKMEPSKAERFYNDFSVITPIALFESDGGSVSLEGVKFVHDKHSYVAQLSDYDITNTTKIANLDTKAPTLEISTQDIKIDSSKGARFDTSNLVSRNDLDNLLAKAPQAKADKTKWLFVVGLESYRYTDDIAYAKRSAQMFANATQKVLGVPKSNTVLLLNDQATATEIKNNLKLLTRKVKSGDTIYFYYNGHGIPAVDKSNEPFILSNDMMPDFVSDEEEFKMANIYKTLSDSKASKIVAVVDSCFSGSTDGKAILKGVAATRVKPKAIEFDKSKMVVLTAGRDTQYSNAYNQKAHRMFSYFVIEELIKGERDIKKLYGKVYKNTKEKTLETYGDMRVQEPTVEGNVKIGL